MYRVILLAKILPKKPTRVNDKCLMEAPDAENHIIFGFLMAYGYNLFLQYRKSIDVAYISS